MASFTRVEVQRSRPRIAGAGRGLLIGGGIGAAAGAVIRYLTYEECESEVLFGCLLAAESRGEEAMYSAVVLGILGGIVGLIGGSASPGERWKSVSPGRQISLAPSSDGGVALGYEYRF